MDRTPLIKVRAFSLILFALGVGLGSALLGNVVLAKAAGRLVSISPEPAASHSPEGVPTTTVTLPALITNTILASNKDQFGYIMNTDVLAPIDFNAGWEELAGTGASYFTFTADSFRVIDIGFSFPFYEGDYPSVYINENGLLTFLSETRRPVSDPIPRDTAPNNYIAAFWDNLAVGSGNNGRVYFKTFGVAPNRYLVVEWWNVTRFGVSIDETLTFQIRLTEDKGDIYIYYKEMNNDGALASSGIEDPDGVDGIQVAYRQPNFLTALRRTVFARPPKDSYRVKVLPHYRGKFVVGGSAVYPLTIRNTSDLRNDTYNIISSPSSGWGVTLIDPATRQPVLLPLSLNAGAQKLINVVVRPLSIMNPGANTSFTVTVHSNGYPGSPPLEVGSFLQASIPPSFALAFYQSPNFTAVQDKKAMVEWVWQKSDYLDAMRNPFSGRNLAFIRKPDKGYVYAWDRPNDPSESKKYREVQFLILNKVGGILRDVTDVFDQASAADPQADTDPSIAATLNGKVGFAWKRAPAGAGGTYIENIFFVVRNADGSVSQANTVQVTASVVGERVDSPALVSTTDDQFVLVWVRQPTTSDPKELWYAVFGSSGNRLSNNTKVIGAAGFDYLYPSLTALMDGKVMLSYVQQVVGSDQFLIKYRVCILDCQNISTEHTLLNAHGRSPQAVQFSNSKVLLAWTNSVLDTISYTLIPLINSPDPNLVPVDLDMPTDRSPDYVSMAVDSQDRAVVVWMDVVNFNYVFYALIDANGVILTPPMSIMGEVNGLALTLSDTGQAIALYDGSYRTYEPLIRK